MSILEYISGRSLYELILDRQIIENGTDIPNIPNNMVLNALTEREKIEKRFGYGFSYIWINEESNRINCKLSYGTLRTQSIQSKGRLTNGIR